MTWFEVFIPPAEEGFPNVTLTVEGRNWMDALRTGLANLGEGAVTNIMCDIQPDNSIHVTEVGTQRVFRLRETTAPAPKVAPAFPDAAPAPKAPAAAAVPPPAPVEESGAVPVAPKASSAPASPAAPETPKAAKPEAKPAAKAAPAPSPPPKEASRKAQFQTGPVPVQRTEAAVAPDDPVVKPSGPVSAPAFDPTDTIADVFDATQELLLDAVPDPKRVAEKLLDLALAKVPADAGTFYLADVNGHELSFAAVRGPKADVIRKKSLTVPVGQGVVGFCAQEGVCLVIRDMQNDSRYFSAIADAVGYQPNDSLCASAEKEGRLFGAIQLINHKKGGFTPGEMEVIRYIGITAADMLARVAEA